MPRANNNQMILTLEAWVVALMGWVWLTLQDIWMPSVLCTQVYYGFLVMTTCNLVVSAVAPDVRQPSVSYFNVVLGVFIFCCSCICDCFSTATLGGVVYHPVKPAGTDCCSNCDIAKANRIFFFGESPLFVGQAAILVGYLLVQLFVAGGQLIFSGGIRSVWSGCAWVYPLALLLTARFLVVFDGSTFVLVPGLAVYVHLFSQPLLSLYVVYLLGMIGFLVMAVCESVATMGLIGFRIVRAVLLGITVGFVVMSCTVFGMRGMLTVPLFLCLCLLLLGALGGLLEALLAHVLVEDERGVGQSVTSRGQNRQINATQLQRGLPGADSPFQSHQMQRGKKAA